MLRHRLRSLTAVSAVAFGVTAMVLANGFIDWSLWGMRESTIRSQLGHIQVSRSGYRSGGTADPFAYLHPGGRRGAGCPRVRPEYRGRGAAALV